MLKDGPASGDFVERRAVRSILGRRVGEIVSVQADEAERLVSAGVAQFVPWYERVWLMRASPWRTMRYYCALFGRRTVVWIAGIASAGVTLALAERIAGLLQ